MIELQTLLQNLDDTQETLNKLKTLCVGKYFTIKTPPEYCLHNGEKTGHGIPLWFKPVMDPTIGKKLLCLEVDRLYIDKNVTSKFYVLTLDTTPNGLDGQYGKEYWYRFDWTEEGYSENKLKSLVDLIEELNQAEARSLNDVGPVSSRLHLAIAALCQNAGIKNIWNKLCEEEGGRLLHSKEYLES